MLSNKRVEQRAFASWSTLPRELQEDILQRAMDGCPVRTARLARVDRSVDALSAAQPIWRRLHLGAAAGPVPAKPRDLVGSLAQHIHRPRWALDGIFPTFGAAGPAWLVDSHRWLQAERADGSAGAGDALCAVLDSATEQAEAYATRAPTFLQLEHLDFRRVPPLGILPNLSILEVSGCQRLRSFELGGGALPRLSALILSFCPDLTQVSLAGVGGDSLRSLDVLACPRLTALPDLGPFRQLESLWLDATGVRQLPRGLSTLPHLRHVETSHCPELDPRALQQLPPQVQVAGSGRPARTVD